MSIDLLEQAAASLEELLDGVVFLGGATIQLWITDSAASPVRVTEDVDVVAEVASRLEFHKFQDRLRERFREDQETGVICRWRHKESGLVLDVMPSDPDLLGFENRWQAASLPHAVERELSSGRVIRALPPPFLLATKLEAFRGRGEGDLLRSRDFEDVVRLADGREELVEELGSAPSEVRGYVATELRGLSSDPRFLDGVTGALPLDLGAQARVDEVVLPRLHALMDQ